MIAAICRRLKPGGRLVLVEFRGEDPRVPIRPLHKMTEAQIRKESAKATERNGTKTVAGPDAGAAPK